MLFAGVVAGLKITPANSAYTPSELKHQFTNSGAKAVFAHPALLPTALAMFGLINVDAEEARKRIIVADWSEQSSVQDYVRVDDLLGKGTFREGDRISGSQSDETIYLYYSSGTTGQPKGVEVCQYQTLLKPAVDS